MATEMGEGFISFLHGKRNGSTWSEKSKVQGNRVIRSKEHRDNAGTQVRRILAQRRSEETRRNAKHNEREVLTLHQHQSCHIGPRIRLAKLEALVAPLP